jgi:FtsH-binding integral membrane protein
MSNGFEESRTRPTAAGRPITVVQEQTGFLTRVYAWMAGGLAVTALVAHQVAGNETLLRALIQNRLLFFGLIIAQLGLVVVLSAAIQKLAFSTAALLFVGYSALTGVTLSTVLLVYTGASVAATFFITSAMFLAMTFYGMTTKRDLSSWGSLLFMGLIGVILASFVNMLLHSEALMWIVTYVGIAIFVGLTAYDTQRLKEMQRSGAAVGDSGAKLAILGALRLYLDFINLFLMLLRLTGRRR